MDSLMGLPAEGFEPPTYGLQNRCTTTVLSRHWWAFQAPAPEYCTVDQCQLPTALRAASFSGRATRPLGDALMSYRAPSAMGTYVALP
jgi:hypothetical protein